MRLTGNDHKSLLFVSLLLPLQPKLAYLSKTTPTLQNAATSQLLPSVDVVVVRRLLLCT
jgi:hypothetical protein